MCLGKDLWIYGQNIQIVKYIVGGLENPYIFTDTQYFLDFFYEIIFLGHVFVESSVN